MSDYIGGQTHARIDEFLVKHFNRPTREERYENRATMLPQAIEGAALGASLMVGTGRVRAGATVAKAGHKQILAASGTFTGRFWPRSAGIKAVKAVPEILAGANAMHRGSRMVRQGRILQGIGFAGWFSHR